MTSHEEAPGLDISVVVPTYNRKNVLALCLGSLLDQELPANRYEVIVVDDASTDGTDEILQHMPAAGNVSFIRMTANGGQTAAKNAGAKRASGRILVLIDDDMRVGRAFLATHLAAHDRIGRPCVVFGPIHAEPSNGDHVASGFLKASLEEKFGRLASDPRSIWPADASVMPNSSLLRSTFLEHGGFDSTGFPRRREDEEFGIRLWKAGLPFVFEPSAPAFHSWAKRSNEVDAQWHEEGAALVRLYRKHPDLRGTQPTFRRLLAFPRWKRDALLLLAAQPRLGPACVAAASWCATHLRTGGPAHAAALRWRQAMLSLGGAVREAGGRSEFRRMFESR